MNATAYYDDDADVSALHGKTVAVVGYGIQGQAFANNLKDSGIDILVGNIDDSYFSQAQKDGLQPTNISHAVKDASVVILLIPDEAHNEVYERDIKPNLHPGGLLIVAHGYSLSYKTLSPSSDIDISLLAPRMFGRPIRTRYLEGKGIPAFFDVYQDVTGTAGAITLALAKAMGFTRAGVLRVSLEEEMVLDLFQEQFLTPALIMSFKIAFETLVAKDFNPIASLMDLLASGEMGEMIMEAARIGLFEVIEQQGSPTCQFGVYQNVEDIFPRSFKKKAEQILTEIQNGNFNTALEAEAIAGYPTLEAFKRANAEDPMTKTHDQLRLLFRF